MRPQRVRSLLMVVFCNSLHLIVSWTAIAGKLNHPRGSLRKFTIWSEKNGASLNGVVLNETAGISQPDGIRSRSKQLDTSGNLLKLTDNGEGFEQRQARRYFDDPLYSGHTAHSFNRQLQKLVRTGKTDDKGNGVAQQAEEMLLDRVNDPTLVASYDTVSFNIVLQAWANHHTMTAARRADQLLSILLSSDSTTESFTSPVQADAYSYAAVLHAYAKSGGKIKAAQRATEILEQFERSNRCITTDVCHNAAMNAWAVSGSKQAGERAERILRHLMGQKTISPTRIAFNACIKAYAKAGQPREAQRLLDQMKHLADSQPQLTPDKITYSSCIDAWSRSCHTEDAAQQAENLLAEMEQLFAATNDPKIRPDVVSYTSVLAAYAKSTSGVDYRKAHQLLERMQVYAQDQPNAPFLNAWINLLAKTSATRESGTAQSHEAAAEEILEYMRKEYAQGSADMKPCKITYTVTISVLAQAGTVASARRAEALLNELETLWERTQDSDYLPNAKTFASVLNAWAKSGSPDAAEAAEQLIDRMERLYNQTRAEELEPNLIVFLQFFQVLANSRDPSSALKAKQLLQKMHALQLSGFPSVRPDATTYSYVINTFTKSKVDNVAEIATIVLTEAEEGYKSGIGSLKPTPLLYSAVLQAYAKSCSLEGAQLAEQLLERTKYLYRQGKLYAKPTTLFYNAVIDAHARSGGGRQAAERAEELLDELEVRSSAGDASLKPKTRTYNAAILAWKNSGDPEAPHRAERLLRRMNDAHKAGDVDCRPDRVTLNSIIGVWARSHEENAAQRAEQFLRFMEVTSAKGTDVSLKPDAWTYNTCIAAYTRRQALGDTHRLYQRMKALYEQGDKDLRPDVITFMLLQRAWSNSNDPRASQELACIQQDMAKFARRAT